METWGPRVEVIDPQAASGTPKVRLSIGSMTVSELDQKGSACVCTRRRGAAGTTPSGRNRAVPPRRERTKTGDGGSRTIHLWG